MMRPAPRLSDTRTLSSKALPPAHLKTADEPAKPAEGSADLAVTTPVQAKSPGVGSESLSDAVAHCK